MNDDKTQLNLYSNNELENLMKDLETKYTDKQKEMETLYEELLNLSKSYVNIKEILDKRLGKNGKTN